MASLDDTSLTPAERRVLERVVTLLEEELGTELRAVWLYGSRARGEPRQPESDVDLLIVSSRNTRDDRGRRRVSLQRRLPRTGSSSRRGR